MGTSVSALIVLLRLSIVSTSDDSERVSTNATEQPPSDGLECDHLQTLPSILLCLTEGHCWRNFNGTIPDMADDMTPVNEKSYPVQYVGYFRSSDNKLHVTTIDADGHQQFDNEGDMIRPVKILTRNPPYEQDDFSYAETLPYTMNSAYYKGNPDLRKVTLAIGVEDGRLVYFGMVPGVPIFGKIVQDPTSDDDKPLYEMFYWHENKTERTENYWVLISNECKNVLEKL